MKYAAIIAQVLLIIGGVNWLLIGVIHFNLVAAILGPGSLLVRLAYLMVGVSALYAISFIPRLQLSWHR